MRKPVLGKYKARKKTFFMPKKPKVGFVQVGQTRLRHGQSHEEDIWLTNLGVPERSKVIHGFGNKVYIVDGFDSRNRIIWEFLGTYYHADPRLYAQRWNELNPTCKKTYRQLYEDTKARFMLFHNLGFQVRYCWEIDFKKNKFACRTFIPGKELV